MMITAGLQRVFVGTAAIASAVPLYGESNAIFRPSAYGIAQVADTNDAPHSPNAHWGTLLLGIQRDVATRSYSVEDAYQKESSQLDVKKRLHELKSLENGWYDGVQGCQLSEEGINWLSKSWYCFLPYLYNVQPPYLFPTIEGNIQAEWTFGHREIILSIDIKNHRGRWQYMDMKTQSDEYDEERELDLEQSGDWNWIFQKISGFQKEQV